MFLFQEKKKQTFCKVSEGAIFTLQANTILLQNFAAALEQSFLVIKEGLARCLASVKKMGVFLKWKYNVSDQSLMVFLADCKDSLMKRTIPCIKTGKNFCLGYVDMGAMLKYF